MHLECSPSKQTKLTLLSASQVKVLFASSFGVLFPLIKLNKRTEEQEQEGTVLLIGPTSETSISIYFHSSLWSDTRI